MRKIPRVDERIVQTWTKDLPKVGIQASKVRKPRVGKYGNYTLTDRLMELVSYLKDVSNVVVIPGGDHKYFKMLEQNLINCATEMVKML